MIKIISMIIFILSTVSPAYAEINIINKTFVIVGLEEPAEFKIVDAGKAIATAQDAEITINYSLDGRLLIINETLFFLWIEDRFYNIPVHNSLELIPKEYYQFRQIFTQFGLRSQKDKMTEALGEHTGLSLMMIFINTEPIVKAPF